MELSITTYVKGIIVMPAHTSKTRKAHGKTKTTSKQMKKGKATSKDKGKQKGVE